MNATIDLGPEALAAAAAAHPELPGDLRSDHAGEAGAVMIHRGIFAGSVDLSVREFARAHMLTEQRHLDIIKRSCRQDNGACCCRCGAWPAG